MTQPVLVELWRGDIVESFHRGAFAVVDAAGATVGTDAIPGAIGPAVPPARVAGRSGAGGVPPSSALTPARSGRAATTGRGGRRRWP